MSRIIAFPLACPTDRTTDVATLAARLGRIECTDSVDEALMDVVAEAEIAALGALAQAPVATIEDAAIKLATLLRRIERTGDGFVSEGDLALLRATLGNLRGLAQAKVAVRA